jgi:hypothetical protein
MLNAQTAIDTLEETFIKNTEVVAEKAIQNKNSQIFDDYLKENPAPTRKANAWTKAGKAYILSEIYKENLKKDITSPISIKIVKDILDNYQFAVDSCYECGLTYKLDRYNFLKKYKLVPDIRQKELTELQKYGYKEDKTGISLGLNLSQGKDTWIGAQLSFLSFNSPTYKLYSPTTKEVIRKSDDKYGFSAHFLPIAVNFNVAQKTSEFAISLFQINAPISLDITKFGYRNVGNDKKGSGFYRPEIGFGWRSLSLSYGYNHLFNKSYRPLYEKHLINLRFTPIIIKNK